MKKVRNIFLVALSLLSVISMGSVASTYAKYTASETDTDTARVAKWDVKFGDASTFAFNLFDTIKDTKDDNVEGDVKDGKPTENIIAPGTKGEFSIDITNGSEVNADLFASFEDKNDNNIPLQYKISYIYDGTTKYESNWEASLADIALPADTYLTFDGVNKATIKIEWQWVYEKGDDQTAIDANDEADNLLGKDGQATVEVTATLRATQRD